MGTLDQKGADELVQGVLDAGVTFFDTADIYSDGKSEKILGRSFKNLDVKKTRCCDRDQGLRQNGAWGNDVGASRGHIVDAVEASPKRLQTDHTDLY
jgi:aryl-alcohol dehydrogenase-like predicted oxidoreductase